MEVRASQLQQDEPPTAAPTAGGRAGPWSRADLLGATLLLLLMAALYAPALQGMASEWTHNESASHGLLVPPLAAWLALSLRHKVREAVRPLPAAFPVIMAGLLLYGFAVVAAVGFLAHVSLLVTLGGLLLYFLGPTAMRVLAFPYAFLFFMVPWPDTLTEFLSFPMQLFSARFAAMLIGICGLPVSREGVDIHVSTYTFSVAAPCSGMKSLVALLALSALIAYLSRGPQWKRVVLFLLGFPLALLANVFRIDVILGIALLWGDKAAEGSLHGFSGLIVFGAACLGLIGARRALRLSITAPPIGGRSAPDAGTEQGTLRPRPRARRRHLPVIVLFALALGAGQALRAATARPGHGEADLSRLPLRLAQWEGKDQGPLDAVSAEMLRPDAYLARRYVRSDGYPVDIAVVFGHEKQTFHSPGFCLLGSGWSITGRAGRVLHVGSGRPIEAKVLTLQRGDEHLLVCYWFASAGEATSGWVRFQYRLLRNRALHRPASGALIRLTLPVTSDVEPTRAVEELLGELEGPLHTATGL